MPVSTCCALDALQRPEVCSRSVASALDVWELYIRIPVGPRRWEEDPSDEQGGEDARLILDAAIDALGPRRASPLARIVDRLDRAFLVATVPDPTVDARRHWWQRRDWF